MRTLVVGTCRRTMSVCTILALSSVGVMTGCSSSPGTVTTDDPLAEFAPVVRFHPEEKWLPMGARWFIDRSVLGWSVNIGCPDRRIAAGAAARGAAAEGLPSLRARGLGKGPPYRYSDTTTECKRRGPNLYLANTYNRPYDMKLDDTGIGIPTTEGFFLDLNDEDRTGERRPRQDDGRLLVGPVPAYTEIANEQVNGGDGLKLSYWLLYGKHQAGEYGPGFWEATHEGDWERFDVMLEQHDDDEYAPYAVRFRFEGRRRQVAWDRLSLSGAGNGSHPIMRAARGTHQMSPPAVDQRCGECPEWDTWAALERLIDQPWDGFGGAWGDKTALPSTTGPVGPHGKSGPS